MLSVIRFLLIIADKKCKKLENLLQHSSHKLVEIKKKKKRECRPTIIFMSTWSWNFALWQCIV